MKTKLIALLFIPLFFTGCASIVDFGKKKVTINSNPEGATVTIFNRVGELVTTTNTPAVVKLERGGFYHTDSYRLHFDLPGYYPYDMHVSSTLDMWYFGNIIFGGALGLVIVDPATGDMWTLRPRQLNCTLLSTNTPMTPEQLAAAQAQANPPEKITAAKDPKAKK